MVRKIVTVNYVMNVTNRPVELPGPTTCWCGFQVGGKSLLSDKKMPLEGREINYVH